MRIVTCHVCTKEFLKDTLHVNENLKFNHKFYCSIACLSKARIKKVTVICNNPKCHTSFLKRLSQLSTNNYCSISCAVTVNNVTHPKKIAVLYSCKVCHKKFKGKKLYCSIACKVQGISYSKEIIIKFIQDFYKQNSRIPVKREFKHVKAARKRFGSWNNAVVAAGFKPNPVLFAKKWIANDGHKCDSFAEKVIDDWLYTRKLEHERSIPYQKYNMTADFKVKDTLIEFVGLQGVRVYDKNLKRKRRFWKKEGLQVIEIYPKNLFPKNQLETTLLPYLL